jgi:membrane protease YdiL (CAAX protease family)
MPRPLAFYLTACAISWAIWSPYVVPGFPAAWRLSSVPHYLGLLGPLLAAFVFTVRERGWSGLRALLRVMFVPRGGWVFGGIVPLLPLLFLLIAAVFVTQGHLGTLDWSGLFRSPELADAGLSPLAFVLLNVFVVGFGEETGWRGYALPRLLTRFSPLTATLWLTLGWALWHWPLFFFAKTGYSTMGPADVAVWLVSLATGTVLFTCLYRGSRGSVLACAVFHGLMDVAFMADLGEPAIQTTVGALVTVLGVGVLVGSWKAWMGKEKLVG